EAHLHVAALSLKELSAHLVAVADQLTELIRKGNRRLRESAVEARMVDVELTSANGREQSEPLGALSVGFAERRHVELKPARRATQRFPGQAPERIRKERRKGLRTRRAHHTPRLGSNRTPEGTLARGISKIVDAAGPLHGVHAG